MGGWYDGLDFAYEKVCHRLGKPPMKEACAEFLATLVLVVLGDGVIAACTFGKLEGNSVLVGAFGWGFALMIAVSIAGGMSGGHVNPAVTVGLATNRKCPWKNVLPIIAAQYLASFFAACIVYIVYIDAIDKFDGGVRQIPPSVNSTAHIFATYPQDFASTAICVWDQILGSALLLIAICAATDSRNLRVPPHTQPIIIGLSLSAIALAFGHNCGAPLNPARDFAPRLFTAICGWGTGVFSFRNYQWFWIPIIVPHIGAVIGVWMYNIFIEVPFKSYRILEELEEMEDCRIAGEQSGNESQQLSEQLLTSSCSEEAMEEKTTIENKKPQDLSPPEKISIQP